MSEYLATALVRVRPDTRGFREQLRADLKRGTNVGLQKIPVKPELKAFRQEMQRELRRSPLLVPVKPDMKGFREELLRRVKSSARGVTVRVPVEVAGRPVRPQVRPGVDELGNITQVTAARKAQTVALATHTQVQKSADAATAAAVRTDLVKAGTDRRLGEQIDKLNLALQRQVSAQSTLSQIKARSTVLDQLELRAKRELVIAIEAGNVVRERELRAILRSIVAEQRLIPSILAEASAHKLASVEARKHATQLEFLSRGAGASGLSLLGVRGATLAANSAFLAGAAAVTVFAKSIQSAAQLETNLNVFAVTAGATANQLERAADLARELGGDITLPGVAAGDAASAFTNLAKAGLDVESSLGAARGVLQLATAAEIENAEATELVASGLNAFGLAGQEAVRVADLLTGAANESQGSITDMGIALQQASAAARQSGLNIEDTVAILTLLARNGLRGSDAGTSLRTALLRLIRPTKNAAEILDELNVNVRDVQGNVRPEVFADLGTALEGASRKQRDFALATIFGADAFRAAAILGRESLIGLNAIRDSTQKQGLAAELAAARTAGFAGQIEALKNNLSVLGTTLGASAIGPLGAVVSTISELVLAVQDLNDQLSQLEQSVPGTGFLDDIFGDIPVTGGDFIREFRSTIELSRRGVFSGGFDESAVERVERFNQELLSSFDTARELRGLLASTEGPREAVDVVRALAKELIGDSEAVRQVREQLEGAERLIRALGRAPTKVELEVLLERGFIDEETFRKAVAELEKKLTLAGKDGADLLLNSLASTLDSESFRQLNESVLGIVTAVRDSLKAAGPVELEVLITTRQLEAARAGFEAKDVRAQLTGDVQKQLENLRREEARLEREIAEAIKRGQTTRRTNLEAQLLQTQGGIQAILDSLQQAQEQRERDAKERADKIKAAQEKAHQATLDAFNLQLAKQQNKILIASATERLTDDIKRNRELQIILKKIIASDKLTTEELLDFQRQLEQARQEREKLREEQRERKREAREALRESLELDVQIAEATGNRAAEARARQAEIDQIAEEIKNTRKGSLQRKRLILELRQKQKELRDLKGEQGKVNDAQKALAFEFLQTQQGFAANLLGNLIPLGAAGGTVGNVSPEGTGAPRPGGGVGGPSPATARRQTPGQQAAQDAVKSASTGGISSAQATAVVHLLRENLRVLRTIARGQGHPEARRQERQMSGSMDTN